MTWGLIVWCIIWNRKQTASDIGHSPMCSCFHAFPHSHPLHNPILSPPVEDGSRALRWRLPLPLASVSVAACRDLAFRRGFAFFGLHAGSQCWAGGCGSLFDSMALPGQAMGLSSTEASCSHAACA